MPVRLSQRPTISEGDEDVGAVDCRGYLDAGETVASVDAISCVDALGNAVTEVVLTNGTPSTDILEINQQFVPIGLAIQFNIEGQLTGGPYYVRYTMTTSEGRVAVREAPFNVR